jgi:2-polyprenyl-3-methyl-5-hydroxy-6-metoxy-1,4-benzoquinol methylase
MDPRVAANRALWNEWTPIHVRSAFYDVEGWKSGGRVDLYPLLVSEVGDVAGKDLLHLQCHFGLDTLAWARRGARVTGADISERAIEQARVLAGETEPSSGVWRLPEPDDARLPLLYSLKATRD